MEASKQKHKVVAIGMVFIVAFVNVHTAILSLLPKETKCTTLPTLSSPSYNVDCN